MIMTNKLYLKVEDVMRLLDISRASAYRLMASLNSELKAAGYIVIPGRISSAYFFEHTYQPSTDMGIRG
jgi:hypothetical protein